eukprot:g9521.t1
MHRRSYYWFFEVPLLPLMPQLRPGQQLRTMSLAQIKGNFAVHNSKRDHNMALQAALAAFREGQHDVLSKFVANYEGKSLDLSSKNLGAFGASAVTKGLQVNSLTSLSLQHNDIGPEGAKQITKALQVNKTLTYLDLENNEIGDAGAQALGEALRMNTSLRELCMRDNNIGAQGARAFGEALKVNNTLQTLNLERNRIGNQGAEHITEALKVNKTLVELDIRSNQIGPAGAAAIANMLKENKTVMELRMGENNSTSAGAEAIANMLKVNHTLTSLNLWGNAIGDAGSQAIGDGLKVNTALQGLNLYGNFIGPEGAAAIADMLKVNKTLTSLGVSFNGIGGAGAQALGEALRVNQTLRELSLRHNSIGDDGAHAIGEALKVNKTLVKFDIEDNKIGPAGAEAIANMLQVNKSISVLELGGGNKIGDVGLYAIGKAVEMNKNIQKLQLGVHIEIPPLREKEVDLKNYRELKNPLDEQQIATIITSLLMANRTSQVLDVGDGSTAQMIVGALLGNKSIERIRMGDNWIPVASFYDEKTQEIDLRDTKYSTDSSIVVISFLLKVTKALNKLCIDLGDLLQGSAALNQIATALKANPVLTDLVGLDLAGLLRSSVPELAGLPSKENAVVLDFLRSRKAQRAKALSDAEAKHTEWYSDLQKRIDDTRAARVTALQPDLQAKVRVICSSKFIASQGWESFAEESLSAMFEGHDNWKEPLLVALSTAVVPLSHLLSCAQRVLISSYRWQDCKSSRTAQGKQVLVPANYGWFLKELGDQYAGWIDFVSHRQEPSELPAVLQLMPYLYALFPVLPQYLIPAHNSLDAISVAFSRGWIYQESALVMLAPNALRQFLGKIMETLLSSTHVFFGKRPPRYGTLLVDGATQHVVLSRDVLDAVRMLLEVAKRRQCLEEVVRAVTDWCVSVADSKEAVDTLFLQDVKSGHLTVIGLKSATDLQELTQLLALMLLYSMGSGSSCLLLELRTAPYGVPALLRALMYALASPAPADIERLGTAQGILAGFSETEFTQDEDEVVGTLSLVALLTGHGSVPATDRKKSGQDGHIPKSQVQFANQILQRCWQTVIQDGAPFTVRSKRTHTGLQFCGLGYIPRALKKKTKEPWHIQLVGTEVSANFEITYHEGRVSQVCVHPDKIAVTKEKDSLSGFLRSNAARYLPLVPGLSDAGDTLSGEAAKKLLSSRPTRPATAGRAFGGTGQDSESAVAAAGTSTGVASTSTTASLQSSAVGGAVCANFEPSKPGEAVWKGLLPSIVSRAISISFAITAQTRPHSKLRRSAVVTVLFMSECSDAKSARTRLHANISHSQWRKLRSSDPIL